MPTIYIDYIEFLVDNAHAHDFINNGHTATCSCGATYTTAHKGGSATCTAQAICSVCGEAYGELASHTGGTATCTEKAICTVCNQAYGEVLAHTFVNNECSACGWNVVESVFGKDGVTMTALPNGENVTVQVNSTSDGELTFSGAWWGYTELSGLTIPTGATAIVLTLKSTGDVSGVLYNITNAVGNWNAETALTLTDFYQDYEIELTENAGGTEITQFYLCTCGWPIYLSEVSFVVPEDPDTDTSATHLNFSEEHFTLSESTTATGSFGQEADGTTYLKIETQSVTPGEWDSSSRVYFTDNRENKNIKIDGDYTTVKIRFKVSGSYNPDCLRFRVLGYESAENQTLTQTHFVDLLPLTKAHGTDTWIEATIALEQAYVGIVTGLGFGVAGYTPTIYIDYIEFTSASLTVDGVDKLVVGETQDGGVLTSSVSVSGVAMSSHDDSLEITMKAPVERDYVFAVTVDGVTRTQTVTVGTEYEAYFLALPKTGTAFTIAVDGEVIMKNIDFVDSSAKMAYWGPVLSMNDTALSDTDKANLDLYKDAGFNVFTVTSFNSIGTAIGQEVSIDNTPTKAILDYGAANGVDVIVTDQVLQWLSHARVPLVADTNYALFQEVEGVGKVYFASGATMGSTVTAIDGANKAYSVTVDATATFQFATQAELNELVYNRMKAYATHSAYYGVDLWDEPSQETFTAIGQLLDAIAYADGKLGVKTYPQQCLLPSYGFSSLSIFETYVTEYAKMITTHGNGIISSLRSDVYPLRNGTVGSYTGNYIQKDYIACIQVLAKAAKAYDLDWELTVQSYGHEASAYRTVSESGLKWQVALAYAFGAKNVSYYTFTGDTHGEYDSAIVTGSYDKGYAATDLYTYVQKATAYAEAIGDVLYGYSYNGSTVKEVKKSTWFSEEKKNYEAYGYYYDSVSDDNVSGFGINSATYTTVLTQLKAADGKYAYGLVNMVDPDKSLPNSVKVTLNGVASATVYKYSTNGTNNIDSETVTFTDGAYTFSLAAGEGIIILPA